MEITAPPSFPPTKIGGIEATLLKRHLSLPDPTANFKARIDTTHNRVLNPGPVIKPQLDLSPPIDVAIIERIKAFNELPDPREVREPTPVISDMIRQRRMAERFERNYPGFGFKIDFRL